MRARYRNLCKVSNLLIYCNKENSFRFIRSSIQSAKLAVELFNFKESDFIIRQLWGPKAKSDNQILRVNMANIRRKIEKNPAQPAYIFTESGVGYRMVEGD